LVYNRFVAKGSKIRGFMGSSFWKSKRYRVLKIESLNEKRGFNISLGPLNPGPLEPLRFTMLLDIPAAIIQGPSFAGLLGCAEGLLLSALAFEFEGEDSWRHDSKRKSSR
jgi:hypothetical protein